jgi:hypothetical protein
LRQVGRPQQGKPAQRQQAAQRWQAPGTLGRLKKAHDAQRVSWGSAVASVTQTTRSTSSLSTTAFESPLPYRVSIKASAPRRAYD